MHLVSPFFFCYLIASGIVLFCIVVYCIVLYCIVLYCIVLHCIACLLNVSFYNSGCLLTHTNIKLFQGLHKSLHLLHTEHVHLFHGTKF